MSLPFRLRPDKWNLHPWPAFFVWAEHVAFGAKPDALNIMVPAFVLGVIGAVLVPVACDVAAILAGLLGVFLGWFNVTILFPRRAS